jgi:UDP-N-acetylglucosamine 1-carboxyvinyltransferase
VDKFVINGGKKLFGNCKVSSAKNAYLPILAGAILCEEQVVLHNYPHFEDIEIMCQILNSIGIQSTTQNNSLHLDCSNANGWEIPEHQTKLIRSSIFSLGSVLGRFKKAKVAYPGGCAIGARPIDLHIKGLRALNVDILEQDGFLICDGSNMKAGEVELDFPSVGATENVMLAATKTPGTSKIYNSAREPEIVDLQNFLNKMGARISGAGTRVITIEGVEKLHGVEYTPIPDRIITGTLMVACCMTGGKITLEGVRPAHVRSLIKKLNKTGCNVTVEHDKITVQSDGKPIAFGHVQTKPYPGFPTDLQPQLVAFACVAKGTSYVTENLFETRFKHIPELVKMGANIQINGKTAVITGVDQLNGAQVHSADLRGGASLVLAGLFANGQTVVHGVHHIDRGYENLENILSSLGADIKRVGEDQ